MVEMRAGELRIVWRDRGRTIRLLDAGRWDDSYYTLCDCLRLIGYDEAIGGAVVVIFDGARRGFVYIYENGRWREYGRTKGISQG